MTQFVSKRLMNEDRIPNIVDCAESVERLGADGTLVRRELKKTSSLGNLLGGSWIGFHKNDDMYDI